MRERGRCQACARQYQAPFQTRLYRRLGYAGLDAVPSDPPAGVTYFATKKLK